MHARVFRRVVLHQQTLCSRIACIVWGCAAVEAAGGVPQLYRAVLPGSRARVSSSLTCSGNPEAGAAADGLDAFL